MGPALLDKELLPWAGRKEVWALLLPVHAVVPHLFAVWLLAAWALDVRALLRPIQVFLSRLLLPPLVPDHERTDGKLLKKWLDVGALQVVPKVAPDARRALLEPREPHLLRLLVFLISAFFCLVVVR